MTLIQINLTEEQDMKVEVYKAKNRLETKAEAVAKMIDEYKAK